MEGKLSTAIYRLLVGLLALAGWIGLVAMFGLSAWRLFATYALLFTANYYFISTIYYITKEKLPAPALECLSILALFVSGVSAVICYGAGLPYPELTGFFAAIIYITLPVLAFGSWWIFSPKGRLTTSEPWLWLCAFIVYGAIIIFSAEVAPKDVAFRYPLPFWDYNTIGLGSTILAAALYSVGIVALGYLLVLLDAVFSGRISFTSQAETV